MANFLTSALQGANHLSVSTLVNLSQIKDNIEKQMESAVGNEDQPQVGIPHQPVVFRQEETGLRIQNEALDEEEASVIAENQLGEIEFISEYSPAANEAIHQLRTEKHQLSETLKKRETQLEKSNRKLAEQEEQLQALKEKAEEFSTDKRIRALELKSEGLLKEGLVLAEKEGKAQALLRKARQEKDEGLKREKNLQDSLKKEVELRIKLEKDLQEAKDLRKLDHSQRESNSEVAKQVEVLNATILAIEKREMEAKLNFDTTLMEFADCRKQLGQVNQALSLKIREVDHVKFQLKEQLDSKFLHEGRLEILERNLKEQKVFADEQLKEARATELNLRNQLSDAKEQLSRFQSAGAVQMHQALDLTAPLLRQIDTLTERIQKQELASSLLLTRAVQSEAGEQSALQSKRNAEQKLNEYFAKVSDLETQISSLKMEATRASSDYNLTLKRLQDMERERDSCTKQMDTLRFSSETKIADLRTTEMQLRQALSLEKEKLERSQRAWELREGELVLEAASSKPSFLPLSPSPPHLVNMDASNHNSSVASNLHSINAANVVPVSQDEMLGTVLFGDDFSPLHKMDFSDSSSKFLLQASELQAGIRRRDIRIKVLNDQLDLAQKQREDLVRQMESAHKDVVRDLHQVRNQNAILCELLGEKEEQIEGLQLDLEEVKQTFRQQVAHLLKD